MSELTPQAFVEAVLAIIADPEAAKKRAKELADLKAAREELEDAKAGHSARDKELGARDQRLQSAAATLEQERQRLEAQEQSLADRADKITVGENELQGKIVAHGQEHGRISAELNTREQAVARRELELEEKLAQLETDRAEVDRRLAAAKAFVDAA